MMTPWQHFRTFRRGVAFATWTACSVLALTEAVLAQNMGSSASASCDVVSSANVSNVDLIGPDLIDEGLLEATLRDGEALLKSLPDDDTSEANDGFPLHAGDSDRIHTASTNQFGASGWFGAEYLLWRLNGNPIPPLVTEGPVTTPLADVAQLDDPNTVILSGNETVNGDWRSGFRLFGGFWLDETRICGIGADYFDVGSDSYGYVSSQDPSIVVGRPFFNAEIGMDDVEFVSIPNELDGIVSVQASDSFRGAGVTINHSLWRCGNPCRSRFSSGLWLLGGYRYYTYESNLGVLEQLTVLPGTSTPLVPGTTFLVQDSFRTRNEFHGGELGFQGYSVRNWWWLDGTAKLALGANHRSVTVDGQTSIDVPGGGNFTAPGGLLTSEVTNIGFYDDSDFVVIPEFRLGLGVKITRSVSFRTGYNVIYWGDVARAAAHLPPGLAVDPRNLPPVQAGGGPDPAFPSIQGSQLVAHGFDLGLIYVW